jgi:hypothetical protein
LTASNKYLHILGGLANPAHIAFVTASICNYPQNV